MRGSVTRAQLRALCERARFLFDDLEPGTVICDVAGLEADAAAVDALARLQVVARRHGRDLRLRRAPAELNELIELMGLSDVLRAET